MIFMLKEGSGIFFMVVLAILGGGGVREIGEGVRHNFDRYGLIRGGIRII